MRNAQLAIYYTVESWIIGRYNTGKEFGYCCSLLRLGIGRPRTCYSWAFYHKKIWIKGEEDNKFDPLKCIGINRCEQGKGFKTKKPITSFQLTGIGKNRICFWDQKPRMCVVATSISLMTFEWRQLEPPIAGELWLSHSIRQCPLPKKLAHKAINGSISGIIIDNAT